MAKRGEPAERPTKRSEYRLVFATRDAAKGWRDCCSQWRNAMADAYDQLQADPLVQSERQYPLKADYATVTYAGTTHERWQYKVSDGGRIWYFVMPDPDRRFAGIVMIERASPGHPSETA